MDDQELAAIEVRGLSKVYRVPEKGHRNLRLSAALLWHTVRGQPGAVPRGFRPFPALQPIDLRIGKGEAVGIIGRNGSGKSTLLQLIAGTLAPTTGTVRVEGSVSALLELGSGFAPEYTGIENIFLNGAILGLSREYIESRLEDIIEFAEIGEFIEQPIKTYSSGMRVRLAFSVLATVRPEILILDEALSVGDTFFQSKCARWLETYVESGGSLLCVSHDMFMLQRLCTRGIVLDRGAMLLDGPIAKAATLYFKLHQEDLPASERRKPPRKKPSARATELEPVELREAERTGNRKLEITGVYASVDLVKNCHVGDWVKFLVEVEAHELVDHSQIGIGLRDRSGQLIGGFHSQFSPLSLPELEAGQIYRIEVEMKMDLKPRPYLLVVGLGLNLTKEEWIDFDTLWDCAPVVIQGARAFWGLAPVPSRNFITKDAESGRVIPLKDSEPASTVF